MPEAGSAAHSAYRLNLQDKNTKPFGSLLSERALLSELETYGPVWTLDVSQDRSACTVTFRTPLSVELLLAKKSLNIDGIVLRALPHLCQPNTPRAAEEERLYALFTKPAQKPANMRVVEHRELSKAVLPGSEFEWRIQLTNGSTQPRELLAIEMSPTARSLLSLRGLTPTRDKPIRLSPGAAHAQPPCPPGPR